VKTVPRTKLHGTKLQVRLRHLRLAKAIIVDKKNYREACLTAGYSALTSLRSAGTIVRKALPEIREIMEMAGITPEFIAAKLKELCDARQYSPITIKGKDGNITIETWEAPDPRVQQRNLELVTEIQGMRRWGAPGAMNQQNLVQVNVSFGGNAQGTPHAGDKAFPVQVKVVQSQQPESPTPEAIDLVPEEYGGPDPVGRSD